MAVTVASFVAAHPEFRGDGTPAHENYIQIHLNKALARTPSDIWGELQDEGVEYLAAHLMANTPFGINAKLTSKSGNSVYLSDRKRLARAVTVGRRVTGYRASDESLL